MNYKDIVKRLKGFDFSKKQKENLADIIDNNSPIYIEINKKEKTTTIFGKAYPLDISNSSWFATIIKDNDLFYYFKNNIGKPIKFILKEIEPGGIFVEDAEGNWVDAESGEYAAEDGKIIVVENGKVAEIREPEPEEQPVEEAPEEVEQEEEAPANEAEDADKDAYIAELEARVAELEAENAELKAKLDEADVALKASAAQPAKEEFKNEKKEPLITRRKFY